MSWDQQEQWRRHHEQQRQRAEAEHAARRQREESDRRVQERIESVDRIAKAQRDANTAYWRRRDGDAAGGASAGTHPVVWLFGLIGAFVCGVLQPWGLHWAVAGFFGFVACGMLAGALKEFRLGRIVLTAVGLGFAAMIVAAIMMAADAGAPGG